jgi:hypothetical protein
VILAASGVAYSHIIAGTIARLGVLVGHWVILPPRASRDTSVAPVQGGEKFQVRRRVTLKLGGREKRILIPPI